MLVSHHVWHYSWIVCKKQCYMKAMILILLLSLQCAIGQINQRIIDASNENKENKESNRGSSSSGSEPRVVIIVDTDDEYVEEDDSYYEDDGYYDESSDYAYYDDECNSCGCSRGCMELGDMIESLVKGIASLNSSIKLKDTVINRIGSFTIDYTIGNITPNSLTMMPRMRLNGSLMATDFRVFTNMEKHIEEDLTYTTIDWQMLMFNLIVEKEINFRVGTGVMKEEPTNTLFNEHTFRMDIFPVKFIDTSFEFRYTPDYQTKITVRREFDVGLGVRLHQWNNIAIKAQALYQNARYYEEVDFDVFCFGFVVDLY